MNGKFISEITSHAILPIVNPRNCLQTCSIISLSCETSHQSIRRWRVTFSQLQQRLCSSFHLLAQSTLLEEFSMDIDVHVLALTATRCPRRQDSSSRPSRTMKFFHRIRMLKDGLYYMYSGSLRHGDKNELTERSQRPANSCRLKTSLRRMIEHLLVLGTTCILPTLILLHTEEAIV
jgi:hypothetical protein